MKYNCNNTHQFIQFAKMAVTEINHSPDGTIFVSFPEGLHNNTVNNKRNRLQKIPTHDNVYANATQVQNINVNCW